MKKRHSTPNSTCKTCNDKYAAGGKTSRTNDMKTNIGYTAALKLMKGKV